MLTQFGVRLPADLVILSRALVTLDGTLRVLAPGMSLVAAATDMITTKTAAPILDPEAMVRAEIEAALPHLRRLPDRIDRILTLAGRGDLRVRSVVDEDSTRILRTLVNRALLAAVGAAFLVVSALLLVAADEGPTVATGTGLFDVLRLRWAPHRARCSSCASSRPLPGTGRHDQTKPPDAGSPAVDGARPLTGPSSPRRASGTSAIPGDVVRLALWGAATLVLVVFIGSPPARATG